MRDVTNDKRNVRGTNSDHEIVRRGKARVRSGAKILGVEGKNLF